MLLPQPKRSFPESKPQCRCKRLLRRLWLSSSLWSSSSPLRSLEGTYPASQRRQVSLMKRQLLPSLMQSSIWCSSSRIQVKSSNDKPCKRRLIRLESRSPRSSTRLRRPKRQLPLSRATTNSLASKLQRSRPHCIKDGKTSKIVSICVIRKSMRKL